MQPFLVAVLAGSPCPPTQILVVLIGPFLNFRVGDHSDRITPVTVEDFTGRASQIAVYGPAIIQNTTHPETSV